MVKLDGLGNWYALALVSEERNRHGGWDLDTVEFSDFWLALDAAYDLAEKIGSAAVFCDMITYGRTIIAEINSELDVTYVNDYANPLRAHLA